MRILIIANPQSHRFALFQRKERVLRHILEESGHPVEIVYTEAPGHGTHLAKQAAREGFDAVVAAGGDGTLNEVINGAFATPLKVGILPCGISNVFAREVGVPLDLEEAAQVLRAGRVRALDLGQAGDRLFHMCLGAGLDAWAVQHVRPGEKRRMGKYAYIWSGLRHLSEYPFPPIQVWADGQMIAEGSQVMIANTSRYGGEYRLAPRARPDDGWLDLVVFHHRDLPSVFRYAYGVIGGLHHRYGDVSFHRVRRVSLIGEGVPYHVDSEFAGNLPVEVQVHPGALKLLVPLERAPWS